LAYCLLKAAGAKRALPLPVGGAFHSPLMQSAQAALAAAIERTAFQPARCPVPERGRRPPTATPPNSRPTCWPSSPPPSAGPKRVQAMAQTARRTSWSAGPGKVLQGLVKKIEPTAVTETAALAVLFQVVDFKYTSRAAGPAACWRWPGHCAGTGRRLLRRPARLAGTFDSYWLLSTLARETCGRRASR
ncbi:MAG: hypothetical protein WKG07_15270, partial [Hymenobacter sp.]